MAGCGSGTAGSGSGMAGCDQTKKIQKNQMHE
jgi:hypothetical protein